LQAYACPAWATNIASGPIDQALVEGA